MNNSADQTSRLYRAPGLSPAWRIALAYAIFGALWILFSDRLLAAVVANPAQLTEWQTYKGWLFVATSTLFLFFLLERSYRRWLATQAGVK